MKFSIDIDLGKDSAKTLWWEVTDNVGLKGG